MPVTPKQAITAAEAEVETATATLKTSIQTAVDSAISAFETSTGYLVKNLVIRINAQGGVSVSFTKE